MEVIKFKELKRLSVVNSDELQGKKYIMGPKVYTWQGIGFVESRCKPDPEKHITVED